MTARAASSIGPAFYARSGKHYLDEGTGFATSCRRCKRDIAAPHKFQGRIIWCLYCGMAEDHVPMIEVPFGLEYANGITAEECAAIDRALNSGEDIDKWFERRARKLGQIWGRIG
jgi:hypothetical protein